MAVTLFSPILLIHSPKSGSSNSTTLAVQNSLIICGALSNEQNMIVTLPFS
jgi:hypothetical protein